MKLARLFQTIVMLAGLLVLAAACAQKSPQELIAEGDQLIQQYDLLGAELKFEEVLENYPDTPHAQEARLKLMQCYYLDQRYEQVRELADVYIEDAGGMSDLDAFDVFGLKIQTYIDQEQYQEAIDQIQETTDTLQTLPEEDQYFANLKLAELYSLSGRQAEAIALATKLIATHPEQPDLHVQPMQLIMQIYREREDTQAIVDLYQQYLEDHPDSPFKTRMMITLGEILEQADSDLAQEIHAQTEGIFEEALAQAEGAQEIAELKLQQAFYYQQRDKYQAAESILRELFTEYHMTPQASLARLLLVRQLDSQGRPEEAIAVLEPLAEQGETREAQQAKNMINQIREKMAAGGYDQPTTPTQGTVEAASTSPVTTLTTSPDEISTPAQAGQ